MKMYQAMDNMRIRYGDRSVIKLGWMPGRLKGKSIQWRASALTGQQKTVSNSINKQDAFSNSKGVAPKMEHVERSW